MAETVSETGAPADPRQSQGTEKQQGTQKQRSSQARTLGLLRWVQLAFMATAAMLFWLLDKAITPLWRLFQEPNPTLISATSLVTAAVVVAILYRNENINQLAHEVAGELSKVTWPAKQETSTSTVVVIVTSVIAAAILGALDAIWAAITDLIYKV